ncbi:MAG: ketol-acid reductoisomerase [Planctomycetota bacterium]
MTTEYSEDDGDLELIRQRTAAIIGYGNQGHAHALNLRDSGVDVIVGQRPGESFDRAVDDGFEPMPVADAAGQADVVMLMLPDETMADIYDAEVSDRLRPGDALGFSHGFNIRFGLIDPPPGVDVFMVSPKGPGRHLRSEFLAGRGLFGLIAVDQDATGTAHDIALAYAKAIGCLRRAAFDTTFAEETEADLFGEQVVLCGGTSALIKAAFDTLVESGCRPEVAYFEVMHELSLIVDLLIRGGLTGMRDAISNTAEYGDLTRGPRVIDERTREEMKTILAEIESGQFAEEWVAEHKAGLPNFRRLARQDESLLLEKIGRRIRDRMDE